MQDENVPIPAGKVSSCYQKDAFREKWILLAFQKGYFVRKSIFLRVRMCFFVRNIPFVAWRHYIFFSISACTTFNI